MTLHERALVIDTHVHGVGFPPQPARSAYRLVNRTTMPPDEPLSVLAQAGVDVVVAKAVGDPVVTRWHRGDPWTAVTRQLESIREQVGDRTVRTAAEVHAARGGPPVAILGVEGADAIGHDVDRLDDWATRGVRVATIVHLADNQIGTTCMPWQQYSDPCRCGATSRRASAPSADGSSTA